MRSLNPSVFSRLKRSRAALAAFAFLAAVRVALLVAPYPELDEFASRPWSVRVLDRDGALLQVLPLSGGLRRELPPGGEIPGAVCEAFVRAEDRRFYWHFGVDPLAAARAAWQNVLGRTRVSGASTITMQLARMVSPSPSRSFSAKLLDCVNAVRIEAKLSKREILSLYLNGVPFGMNAEGVTSAARTFFGKSPESLSAAETACLAVIPRSPSRYNPVDNPGRNAAAAARIGGASEDEALAAARSARRFPYPFECPHLVRRLAASGAFRGKAEARLSVSLPVQKFAESRAQAALRDAAGSRIANAAVFVCDVRTGDAVAWVGSGGWDGGDGAQIDGVSNPMQPGSSMKPFLYALALDSGFRPTDVLADVPTEFGAERLYIPQNFNNRFNGPVRLRVALASSLNVPAVRILDKIGEGKYLDKLFELGFDSLKGGRGERAGLGLALGGGEVTLRELVDAFAVIARGGVLPDGKRVFSEESSRLVCAMLSDKNARSMGFGYAQSFETAYPAIFKTGTANQFQNITALGATREYAVGVWMGNFSGSTVVGRTGSSLPARTAREILDFLEDGVDVSSLAFPEPKGWRSRLVCALSGGAPGPFCPERVYEFVRDGEALPECRWHSAAGTTYPAEYQRWLAVRRPQEGEGAAIDYGSSPLRIASPRDGGVFYVDESLRRVSQIVRLEAEGGAGVSAEVFVDGALFAEVSRPFSLSLPAVRGRHEVVVRSGGEEASARFEVR